MADAPPPPSAPPASPRAPRRLAALLPLVLVWTAALAPFALWAVHQRDPELAVRLTQAARRYGSAALLVLAAATLVALLLYPPFPAWLRRSAARVRTSWSVDRAPLLRALSELQHLETAQRHLEVARLAWLRTDLALAGPHAQRAVELDPSLAPAQQLLGLLLLRAGALPQALAAFQAAEREDPGHAFGDALLHAARVQHLLGRDDDALATFAQHAERHGGSRRSSCWHGEALLAAGRRDEAAACFRAAAEPATTRLTADENWYRALARVRCWRLGVRP